MRYFANGTDKEHTHTEMVKNIIVLFLLAVSEEYFTSSEFEKGHTHIKSVHAAKKSAHINMQ